jgi:adhesin transport system outer membrane protein
MAVYLAMVVGFGVADRLVAAPLDIRQLEWHLLALEHGLAELEGLLASHPEILARQKSVAAAEQGISVAYSGYLPKLDIFGETGPQYIDSPVLKSQGGGTWTTIAEVAGATLTQHVFDGFATPSQVRTARLNLEIAEFTLEGVRQNVLFDGINAYVEVLRQNRLVALSRDSERTIMRPA